MRYSKTNIKSVKKAWNVAIWQTGHLRKSVDFRYRGSALKFARSGSAELRVLSGSARAEGLLGKSTLREYYGDPQHGYRGTLAKPE